MKTNLVELAVSTHDGKFVAHYSEKGLARLNFPNGKISGVAKRGKVGLIPAKIRGWHRTTETALDKILA
ncbi:MAG TPA: hypothetical protein VGF90_00460, partial [Verrucomicrobiae bacterium]